MVILPDHGAPLHPMKTAISLPDDLFDRAEKVAARLGVPRSNLYANAIAEYLERHDQADVTTRLDEVYADTTADAIVDPDRVFVDVEW